MPRLNVRQDRGTVATIVAVLLAGGVLLGMAAFVVDVGTLYTEREELLSGADSAAQVLALDCTRPGHACGNTDLTSAVTAANANAKDGVSNVDLICGSVSGVVGLSSCPAPKSGDYTACLGTPPTNGVNWIEVHTSTRVRACARVAWGPGSGGIAVTISQCEWAKYTGSGTSYAAKPPYPPYPATSFEHVIVLHDPKAKDNGCGAGPAGYDAPGGFGWTDEPNGDCTTQILNGSYGGNTGNNFPQDCQQPFLDAWTNHTVLSVPIYSTVQGNGNNKTLYTDGDSAGFVITGYSLGGVTKASWLPGSTATCAKNQSCIFGFFVGPVQQSTGSVPGPGNNYGVTVLKTIG
jgi:hypothetical protein